MAPWPDPPEPQTPLSLLTFAVLDLETTGLSARGADRICEIAIVRARLGRPPDPWSSLVHPGRPIPAHVAAKTHIDDQLVAAAPAFAQLVPLVQERLAGTMLVAHNAPFDVGFLRAELSRVLPSGAALLLPPVLDTCVLARQVVHVPSYRLEDLAVMLGLPSTGPAHRALPDCLTTWALLQGLLARLQQRGRILLTLADLLRVLPPPSARQRQKSESALGAPARGEEGRPGPERGAASAIPEWPSGPVLVDALQHTLPPAICATLAALNAAPDPPVALLGALTLPAPDAFDTLPLAVLRLRAGPRAAARVVAACPDLMQQASALRWALRGLAVPLAIRKALLDSPSSRTPTNLRSA